MFLRVPPCVKLFALSAHLAPFVSWVRVRVRLPLSKPVYTDIYGFILGVQLLLFWVLLILRRVERISCSLLFFLSISVLSFVSVLVYRHCCTRLICFHLPVVGEVKRADVESRYRRPLPAYSWVHLVHSVLVHSGGLLNEINIDIYNNVILYCKRRVDSSFSSPQSSSSTDSELLRKCYPIMPWRNN